MHEAGGDVEEAAFLDVGAPASARPELEARRPADDVTEHLSVAVVVPAGGDAAFGPRPHEHGALGLEGELAREPGRGRGNRQAVGPDCGDALGSRRRLDAAIVEAQRRGWDSNPRAPFRAPPVFKTGPFVRSGTPPVSSV